MDEGRVLQSGRLSKTYDAAFAKPIVPLAQRAAADLLDSELSELASEESDAECVKAYFELATLRSEVGATVKDAVAALQTRRTTL